MAMKKTSSKIEKKKCSKCRKEKNLNLFYKAEGHMFPDGKLHICTECIKETVDCNKMEDVLSFLRQIDKPFVKHVWENSVDTDKKYPLSSYLRKINALQHYKGKTFSDSDGYESFGSSDSEPTKEVEYITTERGKVIEYSDSLISKWGLGFTKHEYLQLEKYYQDMKDTHEVVTVTHKDMLDQIARMSVLRKRLMAQGELKEYREISKTMQEMIKDAGFRPIDRKGTDETTGLRSFSQIFEEVEKRSFVKPPPSKFDEDIVDAMIVSLANYYHRIVGKQLLSDVPEELKEGYKDHFDDEGTEEDEEF